MRQKKAGFVKRFFRKLGLLRPLAIIGVSDCRDANASMRMMVRLSALFKAPGYFVGVSDDLQAGLNVMDALDAAMGRPSVILANVAKRDGRYSNGSPFGAAWIGNTLIVSTVTGYTLSFLKKLGLLKEAVIFDMAEVLACQVKRGILSEEEAFEIEETQFRSYRFAPLLARWLWTGTNLPSRSLAEDDILNLPPNAVAYTDVFRNLKLTATTEDVKWGPGNTARLHTGRQEDQEIGCFSRLVEVPEGQLGLVRGSSGFGSVRFLELMVRGGKAASRVHLAPGEKLF